MPQLCRLAVVAGSGRPAAGHAGLLTRGRKRSAMARGEDDEEFRAAMSAFYWLDAEIRTEVQQLARAGQLHPDLEVRRIALGWARAILSRRPFGHLGAWLVAPILLLLDIDAELDLADHNHPQRRKEAHLIIDLEAAASDSPDPIDDAL